MTFKWPQNGLHARGVLYIKPSACVELARELGNETLAEWASLVPPGYTIMLRDGEAIAIWVWE